MIFDLPLYHLTFVAEAQTSVHMGPQAGAQIRGTLWKALSSFACTDPGRQGQPEHARHCPMCYLLELQSKSPRGQNPPRPFTLRPPLAIRTEDDRFFRTGASFEIGMVLIGDAAPLFPYIVQGLRRAGQQGVGYGRGQFILRDIVNSNPFTGERDALLDGPVASMPSLAVRAEHIAQASARLPNNHLRIRFLTPTQIKHEGALLRYPVFPALTARILERCQALAYHYSDLPSEQAVWEPIYTRLTAAAQSVARKQDNTRWVSVRSGSRRSNRTHDIGGFVGEVLFEGDIGDFRSWFLWGQSLQIGKNTIKGDGWYEIAGE